MKILKHIAAASQIKYFDNDLEDALVPELWAMEALIQLEKANVFPFLVHRDFETALASFGDTVNAHLPADFELDRKGVNDDIVIQGADATKVPVVLNQHILVPFLIRDGEETKSFKDLVELFLVPAVRKIAEGANQILANQVYQFSANQIGQLGTVPDKRALSMLKAKQSNLKVPTTDRHVVLTAETEGELTALDAFSDADRVGDEGTALREGSLGRKYGADYHTDISMPALTGGTAATGTALINNAAGYVKGYAGTITKDGTRVFITADVVTINGYLYTVSATTATTIVLNEPLQAAIADNDVILSTAVGAWGASYVAGWAKEVVITGLRGVVGEGVRTLAGDIYAIAKVSATADTYLLDRPLDAAVTNTNSVGVYPDGDYNFAFHRHALALVSRPLAAPRASTGAMGAVVNSEALSMRVVISYDPIKQGHIVTIDMLLGVKVLNSNLGTILLG